MIDPKMYSYQPKPPTEMVDDEDHPCCVCGKSPSVHMGHGSYQCVSCYRAMFCSLCKYPLKWEKGKRLPHTCPTAEKREKDEREAESFHLLMDHDDQEEAVEAALRLRDRAVADLLAMKAAIVSDLRFRAQVLDEGGSPRDARLLRELSDLYEESTVTAEEDS